MTEQEKFTYEHVMGQRSLTMFFVGLLAIGSLVALLVGKHFVFLPMSGCAMVTFEILAVVYGAKGRRTTMGKIGLIGGSFCLSLMVAWTLKAIFIPTFTPS